MQMLLGFFRLIATPLSRHANSRRALAPVNPIAILFGTQFAHHKRQKTIAIGTFFALGEWRFRMTATFA